MLSVYIHCTFILKYLNRLSLNIFKQKVKMHFFGFNDEHLPVSLRRLRDFGAVTQVFILGIRL